MILKKRRRDSTRTYNDSSWKSIKDLGLNLLLNYDEALIEPINSSEDKVFCHQFLVAPVKYNGVQTIIINNPIIRLPEDFIDKYIKANNVLIANEEYIENYLRKYNPLFDNYRLSVNEHDMPIDIIKEILLKMKNLEASDISIGWTLSYATIIYTAHGENLTSYTDIISLELAEKIRISLINLSNENQADKVVDGKFAIHFSGSLSEFRLSVIKTALGHSIVIRSYIQKDSFAKISELGYTDKAINIINEILENKYGLFLITGPTGSGKTTTIYSIIANLQREKGLRIKTAEDPVEVIIPGIDQCQINTKGEEKHQLTYETLLRSFLRQRPDMIVVGEVRDKNVALFTIEASLTGHFVISTMHTNNVSSTFTRLMDSMGISKDRIEDSLSGVLTQNLIPKLCPKCKIKDGDHYLANKDGCEECSNTPGFKGQVPIVEIASMKKDINNFLPENYKSYYSFSDSAKDLFNLGIIDKKTLEEYS